jgi:hypothetical protein
MQSTRRERIVLLLATCGALLLASCAHTTASFLDHHAGYSVVRGTISKVEGLSTAGIERLTDGVAYTVGPPGCQASIVFDGGRRNKLSLKPGAVIVHGAEGDYILQSRLR